MSTLTLILLTLALIPLLLALRIYFLLPTSSTQPTVRRKGSTCSLGIFLGSGVLSPLPLDHNPNESQGGHSAEMRTLLSTLDITRYSPRTYVYCYGDDISLRTVLELESSNKTSLTSVRSPLTLRFGLIV